MGDQLFLKLPTSVLERIIEYADLTALSSFGCTCHSVSDHFDLWLSLYKKASGRENSCGSRSLRSMHHPRVSFFTCMHLSGERALHRIVVQVRYLLDKCDSPAKMRKIINMETNGRPESIASPQLGELMLHAAYRHRWKCFQLFITEFGVNKNYVSPLNGSTALIVASWSGQIRLVRWLAALTQGEELNLKQQGALLQTSACGGTGPFTAKEWARRKSVVCPEAPGYRNCYELLCKLDPERSPDHSP